MLDRLTSGALLLVAISLPIIGCTSSQVDTLQVTPSTVTMSAGATAQLTATGIYHHGSGPSTTQDLTSQVTWKSSSADVATVSATGLVTGIGAGTNTITATINGYTGLLSASSTVTVAANNTGGGGTGNDVVSVSIIPGSQSVAVAGETGQFIAIGTTSGGNQVNLTDSATWTSSNVSVATVSSHGLATATGSGTSTITAIATNSDQTVASGTATFTVTGAAAGPLLSISIIPNAQTMIAGQTSQLIAIGTFNTSPATQNVTGSVAWASSNTAVANVTASGGLVSAVGPGVCVITAIGTNAGGGVVTATSTFTVTGSSSSAEPLASLAIVPNSQTALAVNQTAHFIAIAATGSGNTVNLTNQSATVGSATIAAAVWSSSNPTVATIDPSTGIATALTAGTTAITAEASNPDGTVVLATATFTVTIPTVAEPLVSMAILPASQTLAAAGQQANLTAIATTGSGTTVNLTDKTALVGTTTIQKAVWASSSPSVASVDPATGIVTANGSGVAVITAIATNPGDGTVVTATATITSTATSTSGSSIASISVIPGDQSVASPNDTTQFLAIGTTTTGATENITTQVTWSSSSAQIANIGANTGYATAVGAGSATITALYAPANGNVVTGTATFTVTGGTVEQYVAPLTILPASQTIGSGVTTQFIALATLGSTGQVVDVTDSQQLTWSVADTSIATISNYPANPAGVVTGQSAGTTNITAELTNKDGSVVTSTASITVTTAPPPEEILTLTIYPSAITVLDFNLTGQFLAIGTFSQPPYVRDLTNAPTTTWVSSAPEIFPVGESSQGSGGNTGASAGLVTAYGSGSADIIAESTSKDGTIQVAQATFNCPEVLPNGLSTTASCYPNQPPAPELLATVTVFNEGLNTTDWEVTGPSATGTPNVMHCGPGWALNGGAGGSVCTATYPMNATTPAGTPGVVLEAQGGAFGGWSYNCIPSDSQGNPLPGPTFYTAVGPNYCVATLESSYIDSNGDTVVVPGIDTTIGAIFN
jgi:hypothetical protein